VFGINADIFRQNLNLPGRSGAFKWVGKTMKQKKGKDYKTTRQWKDENRKGKNRLVKNVKNAVIKGEFDEDKLVSKKTT
jgi:hypothetical protein